MQVADSSSKIIFEDNVLCCQFLKGYVDIPYLKDVKPENILDVTKEFVPLIANAREADRIKEIRIPGNTPIFLISLIEHKTEVEYNIHMQLFRYMVYIWERYEHDEEKREAGCTKRVGFQYPLVLPIVYYEGKDKWTAPEEFAEKVLLGRELVEYLPNFKYYLVPLQKYSNDLLLEQGDEISLIMLINKMQTKEDVELFRQFPPEKVAAIIADTPEYLLEIIAKVFRAFLLNINIPEEETEELTGMVKERKMGQLFANAEKMDIQAERRKTQEAKVAVEKGIELFVISMQQAMQDKEFVRDKIAKTYGMTNEEAEEKVDQYWKK